MIRALKATNVIENNAAMETARAAKTSIDKDLEYLKQARHGRMRQRA